MLTVCSMDSISDTLTCSSNVGKLSPTKRYGLLPECVPNMMLKNTKVLQYTYLGPTISTEEERIAMVRQNRYVDEVLPNAPWIIDESSLASM
jgi:hypothetical protein